jgi:formate hydrogenlyase subunit 3/multisubunit Na+/H+ antiporter MnhD subunit
MIAITALVGALILAGVGIFAYFGGYWYQLLSGKDEDE